MGKLARALTIIIGIKSKISGPLNKISKGFKRMAKRVSAAAKRIGAALRRTVLVITALAAVVAVKAVSAFMKFDTVMRNVFTLLPEMTEKGFRAMSEAVLELSKVLPKTPEDLGAALYDIVSAGVTNMAEAMGVLELAAKAAAAGVTTTKVAAGGAIAIMNAFGKTADDIESILDSMFATVRVGVITFEQMAAVVGKMASQFKVAGLSLDEMLGGLAFLTKVGINAAEATTGLSRSVQAFVKQRAEFKGFGVAIFDVTGDIRSMRDIIFDLGNRLKGLTTEQQLSILQKIVPNIRALNKAILPMIGNLELYDETLKAVADSHGALEQAAAKQLASLETKWNVLKNNITAAFIKLGKVLATVLGPIFESLTKKINAFTKDFFKDEGKILDRIETFVIGFVTGLLKVVNVIIRLVNTFQKAAGDITSIANKIQIVMAKLKLAPPIIEYDKALKDLAGSQRQVALSQRKLFDLTNKHTKAVIIARIGQTAYNKRLKDWQDRLKDAKSRQAEAQKGVDKFTKSTKTAEIPLINIDKHLVGIVNLMNKARTAAAGKAKANKDSAGSVKEEAEEIKKAVPLWDRVATRVEGIRGSLLGTLLSARVNAIKLANTFAEMGGNVEAIFTTFRAIADLSGRIAVTFLTSFKNVAKEFGKSMFDAIMPTADLLMAAITGTDPEETIQEWLKGVVKFIQAIAKNMPEMIDAFIDAVPEIIQALVEAIPKIITVLLAKLPDILMFIIEFLIMHAPKIALAIVEGFARGVGIIILRILDVLVGGLLRFFGFDPRAKIKELTKDIPGLQTGGLIERGGLANVHEGERVVPAEVVRNGGGGGGDTFIIKMSGPVFLGDRKSEDAFGRRIIEITDRVRRRFNDG